MTRYIDWNYDTHEAIEYEREGECNGCAECCFARVEFKVSPSNVEDYHDGGTTTDGSGIWTQWLTEEKERYFKFSPVDTSQISTCSMLDYNNRCLIHASKAVIQSGWPFTPANVTPFPRCSYSFREINRWAFE